MPQITDLTQVKFLGRHRCPRCRMPMYAEELNCPVCELEVVFLNAQGEVMIQMIAVDDPQAWDDPDVAEYQTMMTVEGTGEMYMPARHLPVAPQRADLVKLASGGYGVRYANRVALEDIAKR
jgi:hypothetical protein